MGCRRSSGAAHPEGPQPPGPCPGSPRGPRPIAARRLRVEPGSLLPASHPSSLPALGPAPHLPHLKPCVQARGAGLGGSLEVSCPRGRLPRAEMERQWPLSLNRWPWKSPERVRWALGRWRDRVGRAQGGAKRPRCPCQAVMRRHGSQQSWTHPGGPAPPTPSRPGLGQLPEPQTALLSDPQLPLAWGGVQAPAGRDLTVALPLCYRVTEVSPRSPPGHTCRVGPWSQSWEGKRGHGCLGTLHLASRTLPYCFLGHGNPQQHLLSLFVLAAGELRIKATAQVQKLSLHRFRSISLFLA